MAKSVYIKHLMTGLEGNSEFCFPIHTLLEDNVSLGGTEGNKIFCFARDQSNFEAKY